MLNFKHTIRTLIFATALAAVFFTAGCSSDSEVSTSAGTGVATTVVPETETERTVVKTPGQQGNTTDGDNMAETVKIDNTTTDTADLETATLPSETVVSDTDPTETENAVVGWDTTDTDSEVNTSATVATTIPVATTSTTEPAAQPEPDVPPPATTVVSAAEDRDTHNKPAGKSDCDFPAFPGAAPWDYCGEAGDLMGVTADVVIQNLVPRDWEIGKIVANREDRDYSDEVSWYVGARIKLPNLPKDYYIILGVDPVATVSYVEAHAVERGSYTLFFCATATINNRKSNAEFYFRPNWRNRPDLIDTGIYPIKIFGEAAMPVWYTHDDGRRLYANAWQHTGRICR